MGLGAFEFEHFQSNHIGDLFGFAILSVVVVEMPVRVDEIHDHRVIHDVVVRTRRARTLAVVHAEGLRHFVDLQKNLQS